MKRFVLGILFGVGILVMLLRQVNLPQLGKALWGVSIGLVAISLVIRIIVMWIKAIRWGMTIRAATGRRVRRAFSSSMIGFAGNMLLPARLGELARVSVIHKHNQIGRSLALTTVGITQLFDLLILVGYFLLISVWATSLFADYRLPISLLGIATLLTIGGLIILQQRSHSLRTYLLPIHEKLPSVLSCRVARYGNLFVRGLDVLNNGYVVAQVLLLTIAVWSLETIAVYVMLEAFHIKATLLIGALLVVVLNLSFAFPVTPGNIGIAQAIAVFLLGSFGVTQEAALAYGIGAQGATYLAIVGLGMVCFYRESMDLTLFRRIPADVVAGKPSPALETQ